ncbi:otospiralin-like [Astyanax mexicanus]|uniref:Otospiralin-like n=1 Tax=Astyanax mexicanus TaxID=7994 RepID=A0A8T2MAL6_ASTMX|nr:otospiralin-like [Astyanax mexicanus]KAG9277931.1 otospiralin-like [Astyanax mexicanus]
MSRLCVSLMLCVFGLGLFCLAEESREKRDVPNWAMTSSDFFGWIEELRNHAGYDKIEELARTFWAHFPSASRLGYDPPAPEE